MDTTPPTENTATVNLDRIIGQLDAANAKLPKDAIHEIRLHRDQVVPKLIEVIRKAATDAREGNVPEGNAHFFALFLLTEFKAKEALPAIIEAISLPDDLPSVLFGDAVHEALPKTLATLAEDQIEIIDELIDRASLNQYVRWAAVSVYPLFVLQGRLTRLQAVEKLRDHLGLAIERSDDEIAMPLVCELSDLWPKEALDKITEAFERDLVDTSMIDYEDVERSISQDEARAMADLARRGSPTIDDTIKELQHWATFNEENSKPRGDWLTEDNHPLRTPSLDDLENLVAEELDNEPLSRSIRVGRNDPCPCGSGKKYKKCCGSRS